MNTHARVACAVLFSIAANVTEGMNSNYFPVSYSWDIGTSYTYRNDVLKTNVASVSVWSLMPFGKATNGWWLSVESDRRPACRTFVLMDEKGGVRSKRYSPPEDKPDVNSEVAFDCTLSTLGDPMLAWRLPIVGASVDHTMTDVDGLCWTCVLSNALYTLRATGGSPSNTLTKVIDGSRGLLMEGLMIYEAGTSSLRFMEAKPVEQAVVKELASSSALAIDEAEYRWRVFSPYLQSTNFSIQMAGWGQIRLTGDEKIIQMAATHVIETPGHEQLLDFLVGTQVICPGIMQGKAWVLRLVAYEESLRQYPSFYSTCMFVLQQTYYGMDFGDDQRKWCDWYERIDESLPRFGGSTCDELRDAFGHEDPWVRLFALRQLLNRQPTVMKEILEKAARDSDEQVRTFAIDALKKLGQEASAGSVDKE